MGSAASSAEVMRFLVDRQSVNCGRVDAEVSGDTNGSADQILSREAAMIGKGGWRWIKPIPPLWFLLSFKRHLWRSMQRLRRFVNSLFDDSFIAQRKLFIYYCGVENLLLDIEVKSVKIPRKKCQKHDSYIHILLHTEFRSA